MKKFKFIGAFPACILCGLAMNSHASSQILKAQFYYANETLVSEKKEDAPCPEKKDVVTAQGGVAAALLTDIAVNLAGKAAESLVTAIATKTRSQAMQLETTIPIDGFWGTDGVFVAEGACLVIHNSKTSNPADGTFHASYVLSASYDESAFRFTVFSWKFDEFFREKSSQWLQKRERDFALKIEFLTPGSEGVGTRAIFSEFVFSGVSKDALSKAFTKYQKLPWLLLPKKPTAFNVNTSGAASGKNQYFQPLNIRVTVIETTKPNQFGQWAQEISAEKKTEVSNLVKDAVKKSLDEKYAESEKLKVFTQASGLYATYKAAWDAAAAQKAKKPVEPADAASQSEKDKYLADLLAWKSVMQQHIAEVEAAEFMARSAYSSADSSWPGSLPKVSID